MKTKNKIMILYKENLFLWFFPRTYVLYYKDFYSSKKMFYYLKSRGYNPVMYDLHKGKWHRYLS